MANPKFDAALQKMKGIHDKKSADYANDTNRYANFEFAAKCSGTTVDQVFATLIGVKLARLAELSANGKTPQNESVQDSRLDLAVYATLWLSYHEDAPALPPSPISIEAVPEGMPAADDDDLLEHALDWMNQADDAMAGIKDA